jgi:restriction endonuclease Mrr
MFSSPFGAPFTPPFGGLPENFTASFDLERKDDGHSIIEVASFVDRSLIERLHRFPNDLRLIDRRKFEEIIAELFKGFGYETELTQRTRDGGKDIIAIKRQEIDVKYLIECKRPDPGNPIGVSAVRELLGVKVDDNATKAILATTTYFTKDANLFFEKHRWELELKDYNAIMAWIADYLKRKGR